MQIISLTLEEHWQRIGRRSRAHKFQGGPWCIKMTFACDRKYMFSGMNTVVIGSGRSHNYDIGGGHSLVMVRIYMPMVTLEF